MLLLLLWACQCSSDGDTGGPGVEPPEPVVEPLTVADATIIGDVSSQLGWTVAFAGDLAGDGRQALAVVAYQNALCLYGPDLAPGTPADDALACYAAETPT